MHSPGNLTVFLNLALEAGEFSLHHKHLASAHLEICGFHWTNKYFLFVCFSVGPKILTYVTKVIAQCLQLLHVLLRMEIQSHILMQVSD